MTIKGFVGRVLVLTCLLSILSGHTGTGAATAVPAFELKAENHNEFVHVTITGINLSDVYAFEMKLSYDSKRLEVVETKTVLPGFSVRPPTEAPGELLFAHTQVGSAAGTNGESTMVDVRFRTIGSGKAFVRLDEARLVSSELKVTELKPNWQLTIQTAPRLQDLAGHWAEASITRALDKGLVSGYGDGTFRPNREITRNEFAVILVRALKLGLQKDESEWTFTDEADIPLWARSSIQTAHRAKIVMGYEDGTFRGDRMLSRADAVMMLARAFNLKPPLQNSQNNVYLDAEAIPTYARAAVEHVTSLELVHGRKDGFFAPLASTTRAEAVTLILAFLDRFNTE